MGGGTLQIKGNNNNGGLVYMDGAVEEHYKLRVTTTDILLIYFSQRWRNITN
jgi:hypothetical protein